MKLSTKLLPILFLSAILVLYSNAVSDNVLDSNGDKLRPGVQYRILPKIIQNGGGLIPCNLLLNITQASCPLDLIFQSTNSLNRGIPVTFTPRNPLLRVIPLSAEINIKFSSRIWRSPESKVWSVQYSPWHWANVVGTGGTLRGANSWFKIERYGDAYKLVYSGRPFLSPYSDVGVFDRPRRDLILTDKPLGLGIQFHHVKNPFMIRMFES